ncbi:hypothetical protein PENTCL1PPCAC_3304, partial [Pristionchus entomophagus]
CIRIRRASGGRSTAKASIKLTHPDRDLYFPIVPSRSMNKCPSDCHPTLAISELASPGLIRSIIAINDPKSSLIWWCRCWDTTSRHFPSIARCARKITSWQFSVSSNGALQYKMNYSINGENK